MNKVHENRHPVREHLISYLRDRLSENGMTITQESLEFTAERYAAMIISNPELDERKLIEGDIADIKDILERVKSSG